MAEKGTEQGTEHSKKKARGKGDGVRSRELLSAVALLAGVVVLGSVSKGFALAWRVALERSLQAPGLDGSELVSAVLLRQMIAPLCVPIAMVMAASFAGALLVGVAQGGGVTIHPASLELKWNRLDVFTNFGAMFSLRSAARLGKSLLPAGVMVIFGWHALRELMLPLPVLSLMRLPNALGLAYRLALEAAAVTLVWSALDYAVEWAGWNKRTKMTKQQIRDEMKETQGNPQVKGRVRQVQNAMRRRRVKADLSKASVVITNPTHYAVALEFSFETMQAPKVLAKGRDLHAAEMKEEARWAGVPIVENAPLARSLYRMVEPGQSIPFELYAAVAGILAWLYRQAMEEKMRAERKRAGR